MEKWTLECLIWTCKAHCLSNAIYALKSQFFAHEFLSDWFFQAIDKITQFYFCDNHFCDIMISKLSYNPQTIAHKQSQKFQIPTPATSAQCELFASIFSQVWHWAKGCFYFSNQMRNVGVDSWNWKQFKVQCINVDMLNCNWKQYTCILLVTWT